MSDRAKRLVERFYAEVWNQADEVAARTILSQNLRFRGSLDTEKQGADGFIDYLRAVHKALENYTCDILDLVATDGRATALVKFTGRHVDEFFGAAATDKEITWRGAAFFTMPDDQITEIFVLGDIDAIKRQLGAGTDSSFKA